VPVKLFQLTLFRFFQSHVTYQIKFTAINIVSIAPMQLKLTVKGLHSKFKLSLGLEFKVVQTKKIVMVTALNVVTFRPVSSFDQFRRILVNRSCRKHWITEIAEFARTPEIPVLDGVLIGTD